MDVNPTRPGSVVLCLLVCLCGCKGTRGLVFGDREYSLSSDFESDPPEPTFVSAASANLPIQSSLVTLAEGSDLSEQLNALPGPVLLDFYADWCGPCKTQGKILHEMVDEPEGPPIQVIKINIDEHPQLAKKLQVKRLPTLMLVQDGSMVKRQTGAMSKGQLVQWMHSDGQ